MLEIIDSSGSGDNPSDTETIITSDDGTITIYLHLIKTH